MAQQTDGLGVAAKIAVAGNVNAGVVTPGYNNVVLSLTAAGGYPETYQLDPNLEDASGNELALGTVYALSSAGTGNGVYAGTFPDGGSSGLVGTQVVVAGFSTAENNGTFSVSASSTTSITTNNSSSVAETKAATAKQQFILTGTTGAASGGATVYIGVFPNGATNALAGKTYTVTGFVAPYTASNGTYICTASSTTRLTLENANGVAVTAAALATLQDQSNSLTYVSYSPAAATVSSKGLLTAVAEGESVVEVSYPAFDNSAPAIVSTGQTGGVTNPMNGLPSNKIYAEVNVQVVA